jgi:hypothetical protein
MTVVPDAGEDVGVLRRQRVLRAGAVVCALSASVAAGSLGLPLGVLTAVLALPLAVVCRPGLGQRAFVRRCGGAGLYLAVLCLLGVVAFPLVWFLPAVLLLAAAASAGPRRRRLTARGLTGLGVAVTAGTAAWSLWWLGQYVLVPAFAEPHAFRAALTVPYASATDVDTATERLERLGATHVVVTGDGTREALEVRFPDDLPADRRERLRAAIVALRDVSDEVELCSVLECG